MLECVSCLFSFLSSEEAPQAANLASLAKRASRPAQPLRVRAGLHAAAGDVLRRGGGGRAAQRQHAHRPAGLRQNDVRRRLGRGGRLARRPLRAPPWRAAHRGRWWVVGPAAARLGPNVVSLLIFNSRPRGSCYRGRRPGRGRSWPARAARAAAAAGWRAAQRRRCAAATGRPAHEHSTARSFGLVWFGLLWGNPARDLSLLPGCSRVL